MIAALLCGTSLLLGAPPTHEAIGAPINGAEAPLVHGAAEVPFVDRLDRFEQSASDLTAPPHAPLNLPAGFSPWWQPAVTAPQRNGSRPLWIRLEPLLVDTLNYSPFVEGVRETVPIRTAAVVAADAEFDLHTFMESKFVRTSDPVGNTLTTGGPLRFRDDNWSSDGGVRKKTRRGGQLRLSQRLGHEGNNSLFLVPNPQGTARLSLSYTHPLLNGAGRAYNLSQVVLAEIDVKVAEDEVASQLQDQLFEVTQAYWDLYLRRSAFKQKEMNYGRARQILTQLEDRREVDVLQSQFLSARAAVSTRYADLNRASAAIHNVEARLRFLVNAPALFGRQLEFVPTAVPSTNQIAIELRDALATALYKRPEVDGALQQTRMAAVRLDVSTKELLPVLNLVFETYVAGLDGDEIGQAWVQQFSRGEPGYTAGMLFEVPLYNRAAKARHEQRRREFWQLTKQLQTTVDSVMVEVEIAVREVYTSLGDIQSRYESMSATQAEVDYLFDRWRLLPGDNRSSSFLLEDLLQAQERLAAAEFAFSEAQVAHALAHARLKRAMGTLLEIDPVHPHDESLDSLPRQEPIRLPETVTSRPPHTMGPR